jgi:hypothetical protein
MPVIPELFAFLLESEVLLKVGESIVIENKAQIVKQSLTLVRHLNFIS